MLLVVVLAAVGDRLAVLVEEILGSPGLVRTVDLNERPILVAGRSSVK